GAVAEATKIDGRNTGEDPALAFAGTITKVAQYNDALAGNTLDQLHDALGHEWLGAAGPIGDEDDRFVYTDEADTEAAASPIEQFGITSDIVVDEPAGDMAADVALDGFVFDEEPIGLGDGAFL
ncbi:MAG: hypothetical protein ACFBWO_05615, partial [Paracoccaceae bacterium]